MIGDAADWRQRAKRRREGAGVSANASASPHAILRARRGQTARRGKWRLRAAGLFAGVAAAVGVWAVFPTTPDETPALRADSGAALVATRSFFVVPETAPTRWRGSREIRAERAAAPSWVLTALEASEPKGVVEALQDMPVVLEVGPAPLWSPYLAGRRLTPSDAALSRLASRRGGEGAERDRGVLPDTLLAGLPGVGPTAIDAVLGAIEISPPPSGPAPVSSLFDVFSTPPLVGGDFEGADAIETAAIPHDASETPDQAAALAALDPEALEGARFGAAIAPRRRPQTAEALDAAVRAAARARQRELAAAPAEPEAEPAKAPTISIVLTAVGLNPEATARAESRLPVEIAFALPPIAPDVEAIAARAAAAGRAALLEAPLEAAAENASAQPQIALSAASEPSEIVAQLGDMLDKTPGAVGVATYLGGGFLTDADAARALAAALGDRGLFALQQQPIDGSQLPGAIDAEGGELIAAPISLDDFGLSRDITAALGRLEALARREGHAMAVAVAIPSTVDALISWAEGLEGRGVALIPVRP